MAKEEVKKKSRRPQALKRDIQNEKKRLLNKSFKSFIRSTMRTFETACSKGDQAEMRTSLDSVYSVMDKGVKRGIFKPNKANRIKARVAAKVAARSS